MPYKSDAQRKKFHAMEARGEISSKVVKEFDDASRGLDLPEHVSKPRNMPMDKKVTIEKHPKQTGMMVHHIHRGK